jgi:asparagine synthase (glutamine-hydrolysing)
MGGLLSRVAGIPGFGRLQKFAPLMKTPLRSYYYSRTANPFQSFNALKPALYTVDFQTELAELSAKSLEPVNGMSRVAEGGDALAQMLYIDTKTWLPDDLLVKADKMTMANSVELRVPLLDHHVLEFAAQLPRRLKLRGLKTKYLLKKTLANRVPPEILNRKKTGFPVPYESWMMNEMRSYVADVLTDSRAVSRGFFSPATIDSMLARNQTGGGFAAELFSLLALELWQQSFVDSRRVPA